jgi:hypothetical protein
MAKSIAVTRKKRGRPATGQDPVTTVRLPLSLKSQIGKWAKGQADQPSISEAIRRLIEQALAGVPPAKSVKAGSRRKAAEMAGRAIDQLGDQTATVEERAQRKRRLIKGPREFRDVRGDQPKKKG